jgi:putative transposase
MSDDIIGYRCDLGIGEWAAYHRHWQASAPRPEETGVRDGIQHLALANRRYGHWRIGALLSRAGWRAGSLRRR